MINFKAFGTRIKENRKKRSLTQEKLAEMLDISTEHLSRIETGTYRPSLLLIEKISIILEIDESELLFGNERDAETNKMLLNKIEKLNDKQKEAICIIIDLIK